MSRVLYDCDYTFHCSTVERLVGIYACSKLTIPRLLARLTSITSHNRISECAPIRGLWQLLTSIHSGNNGLYVLIRYCNPLTYSHYYRTPPRSFHACKQCIALHIPFLKVRISVFIAGITVSSRHNLIPSDIE